MTGKADCGCDIPDEDNLLARIKAALAPLIGKLEVEKVIEVATRELMVWQLERDYFLTEAYARELVEESRRVDDWNIRAAHERLDKARESSK